MATGKGTTRLSELKDPDVIFQLMVLACCIFLSILTRSFPPNVRMFPEILLCFIIFCCALYLVFRFFLPRLLPNLVAPEPEEDDEEAAKVTKLSEGLLYRGWLAILIAVGVLILVGFAFAIPVYFIAYTLLLRGRKNLRKVAIVGVITGAVVYVIFGYFLYLPMVGGLLFG